MLINRRGIVTQHAHELSMLDTYLEGKYYQVCSRFRPRPIMRRGLKLANHGEAGFQHS